MTGIIVNAICIVSGGTLGALLKNRISSDLSKNLNDVFGICSIGMGVWSVCLMKNMSAVVFALIFGTAVGSILDFEGFFQKCGAIMKKSVLRFSKDGAKNDSLLVTALVLFCASATGIYGCLDFGITGSSSILFSKSILDFFTALIFACTLGAVVAVAAIPQVAVFSALLIVAKYLAPLATAEMLGDFRACGGFILIATGLQIANIRNFSIANMIPSMIFVFPCSFLWVRFIEPLL